MATVGDVTYDLLRKLQLTITFGNPGSIILHHGSGLTVHHLTAQAAFNVREEEPTLSQTFVCGESRIVD